MGRSEDVAAAFQPGRLLLLALTVVVFVSDRGGLGRCCGQDAADSAEWTLETATAAWSPRDSSGEAVFQGRMWLLGGWFDSYSAPPRDVWSSENGRDWVLETERAPWKHSDLPMVTVFQDRMWLMGGWFNGRLEGHGASNEVWSTGDGRAWRQDVVAAPWSARLAGGLVEFGGRMWLLGGTENYYFGDASSLKNDVWSTADGREWRRETAAAGWAPRAYHQAVSHGGKMYVLGGGNYVPEHHARNDVWSSVDGVNWECVTEHAPWSPRLWFSAVSWRGYLWVLGGWSGNPHRNWGDVWYSRDGRDWKQLQSGRIWKERHEHSVFVLGDRLWVTAGHAQPLSNEVWSLGGPLKLE